MTTQRISFYAIALALPFLLLLLAEGVLRFFVPDKHEPLFIPVLERPGYIQPNPNVVHRYFPTPELAPKVAPDTHFFKAQKPQDVTRIVIMGGSSAAGFPYGRFGSPSGFMQQRVHGLYPEQNIEFISVAMSSINSYMLRDFVPEVLSIHPDAIYIYAGHNEYLGIMGVGSRYSGFGSHALNVLYLYVKQWRLVQVLQTLLSHWQVTDALAQSERQSRTVMASVAKNVNIAYDSPVYKQGIAQFEDNLTTILTAFKQAETPVFLSTIASNLADQAPFASPYILPEALQKRLDMAILDRDLPALKSIHQTHPFHPDTNFALGTILRSSQPQQALRYLKNARDFDSLRFRAPSIFNDIITQQTQTFAHVHLVKGTQYLADESPQGIIDNTLMLEHLHPNHSGYFLLAESAISAMQQQGLFTPQQPKSAKAQAALANTRALAKQHTWVTSADEFVAQTKINRLLADYPFVAEPQTPQPIIARTALDKIGQQRLKDGQWLTQQQSVLEYFVAQNAFLQAANTAASMATALPYNMQLAWQAAQLYREAKSWDYAHSFIRKAYALAPNDPRLAMDFAQILFNKKRFTDALKLLEKVAQIQPNYPQIQEYIAQVKRARRMQ